MERAQAELESSQTVLTFALWFHILFLGMWALLTLIPGFARYDAVPPLGFHGIAHASFWLFFEMVFVYAVGAQTAFFNVKSSKRGLFLDLEHTIELMTFWTFILVVAIAANILHVVACGMELSQCLSTVCQTKKAFLIAFIVLLSFLILVEMMEIYIVYVYKKRMRRAPLLIIWDKKQR